MMLRPRQREFVTRCVTAVTQRVTNSRCRGRSIMGSPPYCAQAGRVGTAGADVIGGVPAGAEGAWLGVRIGCPIRTAYSL